MSSHLGGRSAVVGRSPARMLGLLLVGVLLLGLGESMAGPYLVLFGAERAHLSPLAIGMFVSLKAVSGIAVSSWLGRWYDRSSTHWTAVLAITASAVGYALLTTTTTYVLLLLIAATFLGTGTAAFAQLFALAQSHLQGRAAHLASKGNAALRSGWSTAWAIGPLIGAALLSRFGFTGLFLATAAGFALVAAPLRWIGPPPRAQTAVPADTDQAHVLDRRSTPIIVVSFVLFHTAMFAGSVVTPLYVTGSLHRANSDVGLLFSVAAVVEIPAALALMLLPSGATKVRFILAGMVMQLLYFVVIGVTSSLPVLIVAQVARGIAVADVGVLGISYFQTLLPHATGRATTLFANTTAAGSLVSGVLAGAAAQILGYRPALLLCGALSALAWLLLEIARRRHHNESQLTL